MAGKDERSTRLRQASRADRWKIRNCLTSPAATRESIHQWTCGNRDGRADDCWQTVFTISEGNADNAHQHYHWQRSEDCHTGTAQWNSENAAQCRFGSAKMNQCAKLQEKRDRIEKHIGNDQFAERDKSEKRVENS